MIFQSLLKVLEGVGLGQIIGGVIVQIIILILFAISSRFFNVIKYIRNKWLYWSTNTPLDLEVSIRLLFKNPIDLNEYNKKFNDIKREFDLMFLPGGTLNFIKIFETFDAHGKIIPSINEYDKIEIVNLIISTKKLKLKIIKNSFQLIQEFIFKDLFVLINKHLPSDIETENEGITLYFGSPPKMLNFSDKIKTKFIKVELDKVNLIISKENIRINGKIEDFSDLYSIIKKNIIND